MTLLLASVGLGASSRMCAIGALPRHAVVDGTAVHDDVGAGEIADSLDDVAVRDPVESTVDQPHICDRGVSVASQE